MMDLPTLALALGVCLAPGQESELGSAEKEAVKLLQEAVDLPSPEARAKEAKRLAKIPGMTLAAWRRAAEQVEHVDWGIAEPGEDRFEVELSVQGEVETTELHVFIPETYDSERSVPLLVALHGAGGNGISMLRSWRGIAEELGAVLLAPTEAGPNEGFAGTVRERESVLAGIRWARRRFLIDPDRVLITGFSRGAHLCWDLALRHPDVFAAAVPCAGGPRFNLGGGRANLRYTDNLLGLATRALIGELEEPGVLINTRLLQERLDRAGEHRFELHVLPGVGHQFAIDRLSDWVDWLGAARREPLANRMVRQAARPEEVRRHWLEITRLGSKVDEVFSPKLRVKAGEQPDQDELRREILDQTDDRTARASAERNPTTGEFKLDTVGVKRVRLLLPEEWLPEGGGKLKVHAGGRTRSLSVKPDAEVFLREFVEHADLSFQPVAQVEVRL